MPLDTANLVKWFQERPFWIQEAARRLLTKENLVEQDLSELAAICRQQGAQPTTTPKPAALPQSAFAQKASGVALRLNGISEVKGIEALNPRSPLTFNHEPLTIVYGGTGVGKSGYIRILNNVCGSKNRRKLLGNVFKGNAAQSCKISYALNGTAKEIVWQPSDGLQAELAVLEIYDSECGQVYVNAENEVTFEPWLLGVFQRLVEACTAVDGILQTEIAALPSNKPVIPVEFAASPAAIWYAQLNAQTSREPWGTGEPGETPFSTRKPERVINGLNDRLTRARKIFIDSGKEEYDLLVKGICSDVRILVERMVEDTLLNEVVRRFRRAVHTQNKIGWLAKIKPEDCQMIDELMTKYSRYEHSQPNEAPVPLPEPDDVATDLTRLQAWLKEFSERKIPQPLPTK
jgi:hypothetical protein